MSISPFYSTPIIWPKPQLSKSDISNYTPLSSTESMISCKLLLLGDTITLDKFVTENRYNTEYRDTLLYPFDGYAIRMDAVIVNTETFGVCINSMCWSMFP